MAGEVVVEERQHNDCTITLADGCIVTVSGTYKRTVQGVPLMATDYLGERAATHSPNQKQAGKITSSALGGFVNVITPEQLIFVDEESCPQFGTTKYVGSGVTKAEVFYGDSTGTGNKVSVRGSSLTPQTVNDPADCAFDPGAGRPDQNVFIDLEMDSPT